MDLEKGVPELKEWYPVSVQEGFSRSNNNHEAWKPKSFGLKCRTIVLSILRFAGDSSFQQAG